MVRLIALLHDAQRWHLTDLYRARWTDMIHDEWTRNVIKRGADVPIAVLVPRVVLKRRLDIERLVTGRIPRLAAAVQKQLERL
ncbi:MAG: DUF6441 family protein [Ramlibacter sp.]